MLTKLSEACERGSILYYWDPECNLLAEKTPAQLLPIRKRMENIIKVLRENPQQAVDYFCKYLVSYSPIVPYAYYIINNSFSVTPQERETLVAQVPSPPSTPNSNSDTSADGNSWFSTLLNLYVLPGKLQSPFFILILKYISRFRRVVTDGATQSQTA